MGTSIPLLEAKCTRVFCLNKSIFPSFHLPRCKGINMDFCTWSAGCRQRYTAQDSQVLLSSEPEVVQHLPVQDPPAERLQGIPEINQKGLGCDTGHPPPWQPPLNSPESSPGFHTWSPVTWVSYCLGLQTRVRDCSYIEKQHAGWFWMGRIFFQIIF